MKIFCIIQGPLITYGQGPNNSKMGYGVSNAILSNISLLNNKNIDYVYVTWNPKNNNERIELNYLKENEIYYKLLNLPNIIDPDHRFKHHFSIKSALSFIDLENYEFILKLRSDQIISSEFLDYLINRYTDKLIVSELMNGNTFYIGDFIYYAKTKIFNDFINSQLKRKYFLHPVIANDIGFKYYLFKTNNSYIETLFNYLFNQEKSHKDWFAFINKYIETVRLKDWEEILWRGNKISNIVNSYPFYFLDTTYYNIKVSNYRIFAKGFRDYTKKLLIFQRNFILKFLNF